MTARPSAFPGAPGVARKPQASSPPLVEVAPGTLLETALAYQGVRYRLGGEDPSGFDCSGFVRYVFHQHRVELPRTVAEQFHAGKSIKARQVEQGDLVFFATSGTGPSHVGIAIDGSTFVHAPGTGRGVRVERFDTPYWQARLSGVRRVPSGG
ncbi:MAG: C40 family peptidase [Acidobacteriota bacterium]